MAQTIKLKRSSVAGNIPGSSDLALGEIAVNTADGALYIKKGDNTIVAVGDNDILHIDTSNGRVGVGTTSPSADLTVSGTIANDAFTIPNSIGSSGQVLKAPSSGTTLTWADESGSSGAIAPSINTMTGDGSTTTLALSTTPVNENATIITFDGVLQHKSTYSLSGGTITFSAAPANGVAVECIVINTHSIQALEDADSDTKIQVEKTADEDKIRFDTAGTERMIIDTSGNVGIGTSSPTSKVHISGTSDGSGSGADAMLHVKQNGGWNANEPWALYVEGYSYLNGFRINAGDGIRGLYKTTSGGSLGFATSDTAPITFTQSASAEKMRIHSNGFVGIGTTSPSAKLQVEEYGIDTTETSTTATTQVAIHTMAAATFRSARFTVQVTNSTDSTYHLTEILMIHDGTTPSITEYGTIFTGSAEATFDADISSGNVRLLATPASTDSMAFKVVAHTITT
jgi:hypothetical protein